MASELAYTDAARADLQRLRSRAPRFLKVLATLMTQPDRGHLLHGALFPLRSLVLSYEGGGYRAVYRYDSARNRCTVLAIGEHATVYDVATKRLAGA